ncbi:YfcE family phosphodiesterase [Pseudodesulfovibrio sp. S3]|uniref:metallophosphoesterase family protein n=1 Tax=unclassified Pseudodesulfovibrio TaxID=2661612 RepID=UPI0013E37535|nr:YfcE family phosphodiesterase [Pseudodesulfovibrio sp. S3]MCJ2166240.1 YfcE family phosphodiesterase [Pseudodesulfovibrio sp. S3-i]
MRIGIISDAHGNAPGLALALSFLERQEVGQIIFLGDAVGYMEQADEVCGMLERSRAICLMGNHEGMTCGRLPVPDGVDDLLRLPPSWESLPGVWRQQVEDNGPRLELDLEGCRLLCVHGSPEKPFTRYVNSEAAGQLDFEADVLLMGHTHRPFVVRNRGRLIVNPGSCGLPRDRGDLLSLAVVDLDGMDAQVYRLPFQPPAFLVKGMHPRAAALFERKEPDVFGHIWSSGI